MIARLCFFYDTWLSNNHRHAVSVFYYETHLNWCIYHIQLHFPEQPDCVGSFLFSFCLWKIHCYIRISPTCTAGKRVWAQTRWCKMLRPENVFDLNQIMFRQLRPQTEVGQMCFLLCFVDSRTLRMFCAVCWLSPSFCFLIQWWSLHNHIQAHTRWAPPAVLPPLFTTYSMYRGRRAAAGGTVEVSALVHGDSPVESINLRVCAVTDCSSSQMLWTVLYCNRWQREQIWVKPVFTHIHLEGNTFLIIQHVCEGSQSSLWLQGLNSVWSPVLAKGRVGAGTQHVSS